MSFVVSGLKSERCSKCEIGLMLHKEVYTYTCSYPKCQFSYRIEPASRKDKTIIVLQKSRYNRGRK